MNRAPGDSSGTIIARPAAAGDFRRVAEIYRHHVLTGTATFEIDPPEAAEMQTRWKEVVGMRLPWLVACADGAIVGYGYAGMYRARPAYRFTVEDSLYLDPEWVGRGVGRMLLARVIEESNRAGYRQMVAVIGDSANVASVALHRSLGFVGAGVLLNVGFKFGRWLDTVLMQRSLGDGAETIPRTFGSGRQEP